MMQLNVENVENVEMMLNWCWTNVEDKLKQFDRAAVPFGQDTLVRD